MDKTEYLGRYAKGWTEGDPNVILQSLADGYVMDDPHSGRISKADFANYFASFKGLVDPLRDKGRPFMEVSDLLTQDSGDVLTAWVW